MKRIVVMAVAVFLLIFAGRVLYKKSEMVSSSHDKTDYGESSCDRIISLSPGITETLFALELGERIVGVTRFCTYPPEALEKDKVGGYLDPNYEAITALQPDLVLLLAVHGDAQKYLSELDLRHVTVRNENVSDILDAVATVGKVCGVEDRARELVDDIKNRMRTLQEKTRELSKPRILISIGRNVGSGSLDEVYVAGRDTFYDELIICAGGTNAYVGPAVAYPVLSVEGLFVLNPEIIIDLIPDLDKQYLDEEAVLKEWGSVSEIDAVKNGRVHVISSDYAVIPGPRFILFLEDIAKLIHPEISWKTR